MPEQRCSFGHIAIDVDLGLTHYIAGDDGADHPDPCCDVVFCIDLVWAVRQQRHSHRARCDSSGLEVQIPCAAEQQRPDAALTGRHRPSPDVERCLILCVGRALGAMHRQLTERQRLSPCVDDVLNVSMQSARQCDDFTVIVERSE